MTIESIIRATARGDRRAFDTLYRTMQRPMTAYAMGLLAGDNAAAEDAVDAAFLDIWHNAHRFAGHGSGEGWVRRIVRNKAVDWLRKQQRTRTLAWLPEHDRLPDAAPNAEAQAITADAAAWVRDALSALSVEQREAVMLCYYEERPLADIAAIVGCPTGTVKTRLFHARQILRGMLQDHLVAAE